MPDAAEYGDAGTDTMGHISESVDEFHIPNLQKLGIANLHPLKQVAPVDRPMGYYSFLKEASTGKDTMTGDDGTSYYETVQDIYRDRIPEGID